MRAVAHNADFAKRVDVLQSVGREFVDADKRKALANGLKKREGPSPYLQKSTGGVRG